jgi:beta-lactamase regulating signal transducer with metallopeptidase domain
MEGYICDTSRCAPVEISKIDQYMISKATAKCVNNNTQIQNAISEFANDIKGSDSDIKLEPILENEHNNISTIIIIVIVVIFLTIVGGLIFYFRYNKKSGGSYGLFNSSNYLFVRHVY